MSAPATLKPVLCVGAFVLVRWGGVEVGTRPRSRLAVVECLDGDDVLAAITDERGRPRYKHPRRFARAELLHVFGRRRAGQVPAPAMIRAAKRLLPMDARTR